MEPNQHSAVLIDEFLVPVAAEQEFEARLNRNRAFIKNVEGFIADEVFKVKQDHYTYKYVTVAKWEDESLLANAKALVQKEYQRQKFDLKAFVENHRILMKREAYQPYQEPTSDVPVRNENPSNPDSQSTLNVINALLEAQQQFLQHNDDEALDKILALFSDGVDFYIPGDERTVTWIGKKRGRPGVAHFYEELRKQATPQQFDIHFSIIDGEKAVLVGELQTLVKRTGKLINSEFAFVFKVESRQITHFRLFEDSWAVANAVRIAE